jgi:hypothetical protein
LARPATTTDDSTARRHPEDVAAVVNALIVLFLPVALLSVGMFAFPSSSEVVRPEESFYASSARHLLDIASVVVPLVPFAALAGWRTWVHARRYCDGHGSGWQGVIEGGMAGLVGALLVLARGIATRPQAAAPYIVTYGGGSLLLGLAFGLVLRTAAVLVLKHRGGSRRKAQLTRA